MRKILYIIGMAVAMSFAACQKDANVVDSPVGDGAVAFSAESISPLTRVSGTSWEADDAIGITMVGSESQSVIYDNYKYLASGDGAAVSFTAESKVVYFAEGSTAVDFIAYYPYDESWSYEDENMTLNISGQDGTAEEQDKIDLLISNNCRAQTEGEQKFQFTHALSKVQISVSNYDAASAYEDLDSLAATIYNVDVEYDAVSTSRVTSSATADIKMVKTTTDDNNVIFTAIVTPGAVVHDIIFTDGTNHYSAQLNIESAEAGKLYSFTATVGDQGSSYVVLSGDGVTDWDTQGDSALINDIVLVDGVYQIYTATGMKIFADLVNDVSNTINGLLMNDIDLGGSESNQWSAIGWRESSTSYCGYSGTFDGGGFKVSGLYINTLSDYQGLFGYISGATISNLGVDGSVTGGGYVGGVVGYSYSYSSVTDCYNMGSVEGSGSEVGGVVGYSYSSSSVTDCYNTGEVTGAGYVGGVVGRSSSYSSSVTNCYNTGAVTGSGSSVGGVVGYSSSSSVTNCYNTREVTGEGYVGGVVGENSSSSVINCYNTGSVKGSVSSVGGVVGYNYSSSVINCYNTGSVEGSSNVGGVVGYSSSSSSSSVTNCYNTVAVVGSGSFVGGVVGYSTSGSMTTNCYFNSDVTNKAMGWDANSSATTTTGYSTGYMQSSSFTKRLNNGAYTYNLDSPTTEAYAWVTVSGDYPTLDTNGTPTYTELDCTAEGSGTEDDPYLISEGEQLRNLATTVNAGEPYSGEYFKMTCNIDLEGSANEFTAIGTSSNSFQGTFDGGGYEVSGLYINTSSDYQGLFGYTEKATIKNVGVSGSVTANARVGGIVGYAYITTIENCYNTGDISGSNYCVGGIAGYACSTIIENCYNTGDMSGSNYYVGGIVGYTQDCTIESCYNTGTVSSTGQSVSRAYTGGIVGYFYGVTSSNDDVTEINNCYNRGEVSAKYNQVGGIAGCVERYANVKNCYNTAEVTGAESVGGVVGYCSYSNAGNVYIENCYNTGEVSGTSYCGGVFGYANASGSYYIYITNCSYDSSTYSDAIGYTNTNTIATNVEAVSGLSSAMTNGTFAAFLNGVQDSAPWAEDTDNSNDGYPVIQTPAQYDPSTATYKINNAYELKVFAGYVNSGYVKINAELMADIELNGSADNPWTPIGTGESSTTAAYAGVFDGNGYTISGLYVSGGTSKCQALFGSVYGGAVKNLTVSGEVISSTNDAAGIAGYSYDATFENCHNNASINVTGGNGYVGGIVGIAAYTTTITNCSNAGTIYTTKSDIGGIVGAMDNTTVITNCYNTAKVSGDSKIGGIVGRAINSASSVANCYNTGEIEGTSDYVGGVVGSAESVKMDNCYNTGSVSGSSSVGGIVGSSSSAVVSNCTYDSSTYKGSAIGSNSGTSTNVTSSSTLISTMTNGSFSSTLGTDNWKEDYTTPINSGYPILIWQ